MKTTNIFYRALCLMVMALCCVGAKAQEESSQYAYDSNGNLTKDLNKNISNIQYNSLNLPSVVTFGNGNTITYTYAADGRKLRTVHVIDGDTTTTDYCGNVIYENGVAKRLLTEVGYIDLTDNSYHYYIKDHLGNVRIVADADGNVEESNQYDPFGLPFANSGSSVQPYKYNGKELDTKNGLNLYDYGARYYDPAIARFTTMDPLAEKYYSVSPYAYCLNNPVKYVDIKGLYPGPGDLFASQREAAKDWGWYYNGASILRKREMASPIFKVISKGIPMYMYTEAKILGPHSGKMSVMTGQRELSATIHSHGEYTGELNGRIVKDNDFSPTDIKTNKRLGVTGFLATPNGSLLEYNPQSDEVKVLSTDLPSDPNDPGRLNEVAPVDNTRSFLDKIKDYLVNLFK